MKKNKLKIHFIGIGGIGTSALASYYLKNGAEVSGSDLVSSEITKALEQRGAKIFIGKHSAKNLSENVNLVIYSPAITKNNVELKKAKKLKIECKSYPEALGILTKKYFTIAVCGTHGKSTTAAMLGLVLKKAGLDPNVIIGTKLKEFGDSNFRAGKSKYLVIEADEHFGSFLNYWPQIIILTSLEPDHLDYYRNFENYVSAFKKFISKLPVEGFLVANRDDKNIFSAIFGSFKNILWYSLKDKESKKIKKILKIPGEFNVSNALAVLKLAKMLKIPEKTVLKTLSQYKGSWRRFEIKKAKLGKKKIIIVHDYGHHPTEILKTLEAAREKFKNKKIFCVFQPHQYQRTFYLFNEFIKALRKAPVNVLIITDIYDVAGREDLKIKKRISAQKLQKVVNKNSVIYIEQAEIINFLKKNLKGREVVIFMGAGDIYETASKIQVDF